MADASVVVADPVVRQMGTLVGSLCHNDPAGDWGVVALAGRAQIVVHGSEAHERLDRRVSGRFVHDGGQGGEMATEVRFPVPGARTSGCVHQDRTQGRRLRDRFGRVQVTLAADGTIAQAGIAIGAQGPTAMRVAEAEKLLTGKSRATI